VRRILGLALGLAVGLAVVVPALAAPLDYTVDLRTVLTHDDGKFLWFHPRATPMPDGHGVVMTLQKHLHKSDFYSGVYVMHSDDGERWEGPELHPQLDWEQESEDVVIAVCDVTPGWHAPTGKVLAIGAKVRYRDGKQLYDAPQSRAAAYAVHNPRADEWSGWKLIEPPDPTGAFYLVTAGCVQWLVADNGDVLVPIYFRESGTKQNKATVMRCSFDGDTLRYRAHGDVLSLPVERGLVEPSLTRFDNRYFLTLRNDVKAYVTRGDDGMHFEPIRPWTFDDGEEIGSYNTQQHWLTHSDGLYLVYTRRGADNDHIMRNRAPLFMARVNPQALHLIRSTERAIVPERGGTLGNFGATALSRDESWVTVSEGVWNEDARKRGATGATFIARILWSKPNLLVENGKN